MSTEHAAVSLWRTRITWAMLGAAVSAVLLWDRGSTSEPATRPVQSAVAVVEPIPGRTGSDDGPPVAAAMSTTGADAETDAETTGLASTGAETSEATAAAGSTTGALDAATEGATEGVADTDDESLPRIPLPRMPGTRFMRRARQIDPDTAEQVIILGLTVPAPGSQVEGFYRRALRDANLKVFGSHSPQSTMQQGHRSTIRSRGKHASAEVTIHQRAGRLRSAVRIYWRIKA